jgi:hypothetical protein
VNTNPESVHLSPAISRSRIFGYHEGDRLLYAARTRNGFTRATRAEPFRRLRGLDIKTCPSELARGEIRPMGRQADREEGWRLVAGYCVYPQQMSHDCHGWRCEAHSDQEWPHQGCGSSGVLCVDAACPYGRDNISVVVRGWREDADHVDAGRVDYGRGLGATALRRQADELERTLDRA